MDFAKAFAKVSHSLLVKKLHTYGIKGITNRLIKNCVSGRAVMVHESQPRQMQHMWETNKKTPMQKSYHLHGNNLEEVQAASY